MPARSSVSMSSLLQDRFAVVTGAAGGIGAAITSAFIGAGATVAAVDLNGDGVAAAVGESGPSLHVHRCDLTSERDIATMVADVAGAFGRIDILVNAAAFDEPRGSILELSVDVWDKTFAANVRSAFLMSRAIIPIMAKNGGGNIVHIASQLGHVATAKRPVYCSTKGALIQLTKAMAIDHVAEGIRVNSLSPGAVATTRLSRRYGTMDAASAALASAHLMGRLGHPEEIAAAAVFLASDQSSFMTGADLLVDGGYTAV